MFLFKLIGLLFFVAVCVGIVWVALRLMKESEELDVKELKNDIKLKSDLVDVVAKYTQEHADEIKKAKSTEVDEFLKIMK